MSERIEALRQRAENGDSTAVHILADALNYAADMRRLFTPEQARALQVRLFDQTLAPVETAEERNG